MLSKSIFFFCRSFQELAEIRDITLASYTSFNGPQTSRTHFENYKRVAEERAVGEWKSRFYNHKLSFKHKRYSNKTTLASYMWHLKSVSSETPNLKWFVLRCVPRYSNISKKCLLCLYEKLETVIYQNQKEI